MIIALAGRRIDAPGAAPASFPLENVPVVRRRLEVAFGELRATTIVSSAACGADLIALDIARTLGMARRVVLPFSPERFRSKSVTDRPGDWGALFDNVIAELRTSGDLLTLHSNLDEDAAYAAVNQNILEEAAALSSQMHDDVQAVLVWNSNPRVDGDLTQSFGDAARGRGWPVVNVDTLSNGSADD